jgi:hypothetical protein
MVLSGMNVIMSTVWNTDMKNGVTEKYFIMYHREGQEPYNEQGNRHGYWEVYSSDKLRYFKRNYVNGVILGLEEIKSSNPLILIYNAR